MSHNMPGRRAHAHQGPFAARGKGRGAIANPPSASRHLGAADHAKLYAGLGRVDCPPGCHACCGAVPWSAHELSHLSAADVAKLDASQPGEGCPFGGESGCEVYDRRPYCCRAYGAVEGLACAAGATCPTGLLPRRESERRIKRYAGQTCYLCGQELRP